ncbi:RidA family protein [Microtetraspora malaysiensis]|uniref:RidA family protein n=1 Tax=Microtetraspora malaysiensis TaxID=161358 RepID=UPI000831E6F3|nr:RidA family protein [Microtetraspora malaysiensis]
MLDTLPDTPPARPDRPPVAPVRRDGGLLVASGQVASAPGGRLIATGTVGAGVDLATARACAWQCARNVLAAVRAEVGSLDRVTAVKVTVYVACAPGFGEQHLVADAATELLLTLLGPERGAHARAAIGVAALPLGSPVEVEGTFRIGDD